MSKTVQVIHPVFVAYRLLNMILLVVSPCVPELHPHSFSLCKSIRLSGPPPFLSSLTLTKTYCTDMSACPHNSTVRGSDKQLRLHIVSVYDRQRLQPSSVTLSTETHCPRRPLPPLPLVGLNQQASVQELLCTQKMLLPQSFPLISTRIPSTNEMHISAHKRGQMQLLQMWAGSSCASAASCC